MDYRNSNFQKLDPKWFKAFIAAVESRNFTQAAEKVQMTQSGVSQQIAKLEEQLGYPLFKRIGKTMVLTEIGENLAKYVRGYIADTETFLDSIREDYEKIRGPVSYAMPPSCLFLNHFSAMLEKRKMHPEIELRVVLAGSPSVLDMVLRDKVDFGFTAMDPKHPFLHYEKFGAEEYLLVGSNQREIKTLSQDNLLQKKFITYPGADVYYDIWLKHYFRDDHRLDHLSLLISGKIDSIEGAIHMVTGGLGMGVFPRHCIEPLLHNHQLFEFKGERLPPTNYIYMVKIAGHPYPKRVEAVMQWFLETERSTV